MYDIDRFIKQNFSDSRMYVDKNISMVSPVNYMLEAGKEGMLMYCSSEMRLYRRVKSGNNVTFNS